MQHDPKLHPELIALIKASIVPRTEIISRYVESHSIQIFACESPLILVLLLWLLHGKMKAWIWSITEWLSWGPSVSTMYWYLVFDLILENWEWINTFQFHKDLCTQYLGLNVLKYFNNKTTNWKFWDWDIFCLSMISCRIFWSNVTSIIIFLTFSFSKTFDVLL